MKRLGIAAAIVVLAVALALALALLREPPRRPRPEGWKAPWAALPLEREGEWALDPLKRGVVQAEFFGSTDQLTSCVQRYEGGEGGVIKLELLVETEQGGTHFEYVDAEPRTELPRALVSCLTRALEHAPPLPTPGLAEGTLWRLEVSFLVPRLADLPPSPWWKRFVPEGWGPGRSPEIHIG